MKKKTVLPTIKSTKRFKEAIIFRIQCSCQFAKLQITINIKNLIVLMQIFTKVI